MGSYNLKLSESSYKTRLCGEIYPSGIGKLTEVQRTGDIFFPRNWVGALLRNHDSEAAYKEVEAFLSVYPDYPPLLKNKILQAAYPLYRKYADKKK